MVHILELKTTQSTAIKIVVDAINSLLNDANFDFYPKYINSETQQVGGVVVKEINKTGKILVYMKLDATKFDVYNYNYHTN
jgi:Mg2+/Co2+ transporter CorC